jgi:hypothetical protein
VIIYGRGTRIDRRWRQGLGTFQHKNQARIGDFGGRAAQKRQQPAMINLPNKNHLYE